MNNRVYAPSFQLSYFPLLVILTLLAMLIILSRLGDESEITNRSEPQSNRPLYSREKNISEFDLNKYSVITHKGNVSLQELNENVFKPFGYEITVPTLPVPTLRMLKEPKCEEVFSEWLKISNMPQPDVPPEQLPVDYADEFLLNGYSALSPWYFNDHSKTGDHPRNWDKISELMKLDKTGVAEIAYRSESEGMYNAMKHYRLDGMTGFVVGSMQPWVEVMALQNGAEKILTVEYNQLNIQEEFRDRLSSILPVDFVRNWKQYAGTFDFAATFSSIEHSGLGRYGDPIDPIGDLREMLKIKCMLKKGGLLFLGVPYGTDAIHYNAHRYYGSVRLAMMFYGFEWLGTYSGESEEPFNLNTDKLHSRGLFQLIHWTTVLRKL
uniref:DUF268 domain-containing protein n=1 Tax=Caenorhabditis tropicalis TaxID=1561998 RepID=A0A1I7TW12_9PELO